MVLEYVQNYLTHSDVSVFYMGTLYIKFINSILPSVGDLLQQKRKN